MKNFVQEGNKLTVIAPYDLESGEMVIVEDLFGIAIVDALQNQEVTVSTTGVYDLDKDDQAISQGLKAYYREDSKQVSPLASHKEGENEVPHPLVGIFVKNSRSRAKKAQVKLAQAPT